jgi:hypothetical protein
MKRLPFGALFVLLSFGVMLALVLTNPFGFRGDWFPLIYIVPCLVVMAAYIIGRSSD